MSAGRQVKRCGGAVGTPSELISREDDCLGGGPVLWTPGYAVSIMLCHSRIMDA